MPHCSEFSYGQYPHVYLEISVKLFFWADQEDVFKIEAVSLGKLQKVKVAHDNSGLQSSWYLGKIEVEDTSVS